MMNKELEQKVKATIDLLVNSLSNDVENNREFKLDQPISLNEVLDETRRILGSNFNFYPSTKGSPCYEIAFFASLTGSRWNLKPSQKLSFKKMFEYLIMHCQGSCAQKTKYAIIVTDTWDDDIADFWKDNIANMNRAGISLQVNIQLLNNRTTSYLM